MVEFAKKTNETHLNIVRDLYKKGKYQDADYYLRNAKKYFTKEKFDQINRYYRRI